MTLICSVNSVNETFLVWIICWKREVPEKSSPPDQIHGDCVWNTSEQNEDWQNDSLKSQKLLLWKLSFLSFYYKVEADSGFMSWDHVTSIMWGMSLLELCWGAENPVKPWVDVIFLSSCLFWSSSSDSRALRPSSLSPSHPLHSTPHPPVPSADRKRAASCCWICKKVSDGSECTLQPLCFSKAFRHS